MKPLFISVFLLISGIRLGAQNDTTFITTATEEGVYEKQTFNDRYEEAFGARQPVRVMVKFFNFFAPTVNELFPIGIEIKATPALSLNATVDTYVNLYTPEGAFNISPAVSYIRLEPRYYYAMPRRIRAGKSASNVSGNYVSLEATFPFNNKWQPAYGNSLAARFGIQRRLFKAFYFDVSAGAGVQDNRNGNAVFGAGDYVFFFSPRILGGIGLVRPGASSVRQGAACDVLGCYQEENRMFKIDLANALRMTNLNALSTAIHVAAEQKIGSSPFSMEANAGVSAWRRHAYHNNGSDNDQQALHAGVEGRWYFSLKRRIATGKSGNNLQGFYVAAAVNSLWFFTQSSSKQSEYEYRTRGREIYLQPKIGFQQRLFKRAYIDLSVGPSVMFKRATIPQIGTHTYDPEYEWISSRFRVGVAF